MNKRLLSYYTNRKAILVFLFVSVIFLFNIFCKKRTTEGIKSFVLYYKWDLVKDANLEVVTFSDSIQLFERDDIVLYRFSRPYEKTRAEFDSAGDIKSERLLNEGVRYNYFFQNRKSKTGLLFDSMNSVSYKILNSDTFLKPKLYFNEAMFFNKNDSLISVLKEGYRTIEIYTPKVKPDNNYPDTSILIFSDTYMSGINYSLAPSLDSIKKMKLHKVVFIHNRLKAGESTIYDIPRREMVFEIKEMNEADENISFFFDRAWKILKKNICN